MTIADLLTHHGHKKPRWVDVGGRVVFGAPAVATSGALAMKPHTFHGGEDPVESIQSDSPWWTDPENLKRHTDAMTAHFPGFIFLEPEDGNTPAWAGELDTGRGRFQVLVMTRADRGLPWVSILGPKIGMNTRFGWKMPPHTFVSGRPCIADQDDWNPDEDTVATAVAWTAHWLAAYTEWRIIKRWPIEGFQPNVAA
jgi:hypothetical protein